METSIRKPCDESSPSRSSRGGPHRLPVPSKLYGILAAGRPYVAAVEDESEVTAITERYNCGLLAAPGKPRELADRILKLYYDRPLARVLGANARRAALDFDRRRQVQAY